MSEPSYPVSCQSCTKPLYGPVKFCPYCGGQLESSGETESAEQLHDAKSGRASRDRKAKPNVHLTEPPPESAATTASGKASDKPGDMHTSEIGIPESNGEPTEDFPISTPEPTPGKWTWALLAIAIIGLLCYLVFIKAEKNHPQPKSITWPLPGPTTINNGKRETARVLGLEALRQGTALSVTISKLPKLEKVVQAAKKLNDISPRYQSEVTKAEGSLNDVRDKRDKSFMAYINKVVELNRYSPSQISSALESIQNGDLTPREKIVFDLLASHLHSLRQAGKPDPTNWLSDFTRRFTNFVD